MTVSWRYIFNKNRWLEGGNYDGSKTVFCATDGKTIATRDVGKYTFTEGLPAEEIKAILEFFGELNE
jgi:hypothetical protein